MSFAVMTGSPTKAQLYLDTILDDLVAETKKEQDRYSLAKIIFKCLRDHPDEIRQTDGTTGDAKTNKQILDQSIKTALAIQAAGFKPKDKVLIISRNFIDWYTTYYACLFGGFVSFPLQVGITAHELKHYISLCDARLIFADEDNLTAIEQTLNEINANIPVVMLGPSINTHHKTLTQFIAGIEDRRIKDFWPSNSNDLNNIVMLMATSGSTGLPKAVKLSSIGFVSQLATMCYHSEVFTEPTKLIFCTSAPHWMTHTIFTISTPIFKIPLLRISEKLSANNVSTLVRKYQPTRMLMPPTELALLASQSGGDLSYLSCLEILSTGGAPLTQHLYKTIKAQVGSRTIVNNGFGMTETHCFVFIPNRDTPFISQGKIINTFLFKIVDENGNALGLNQPGELYLRSKCVLFEGYLNDEKATQDSFTEDGWFKTGDRFYVDETGNFYFVDKIKFSIKYLGNTISPMELEHVIYGVEGVEAAVVFGADKGPGALVKVKPGFDFKAQTIHDTVKSTLSDNKRLRSGIIFVSTIPLLPNGKLDRNKVKVVFENTCEKEIHYDEQCLVEQSLQMVSKFDND